MSRVVISSDYRVSLPVALCRFLGVEPGDTIEFRRLDGRRLAIEKADVHSPAKKPPEAKGVVDNDFRVRLGGAPDDDRRGR